MGAKLSYPTVDLSGKVAIVTGGNTGIGYETAKALALMGAHTIVACRSQERATAAIERMKQEGSQEQPEKQLTVEYMQLDLASFQSTKDFTVAFKEKNLPLHLLINNAGLAFVPYTKTVDGNELHCQVNYLSHFLLTLELLPSLLDTASTTGDGRIIFISSAAHTFTNWNAAHASFNMTEEQYSRTKFYSHSKLYTTMVVYSLQRRLQNVGITVSSVHPGFVDTEAQRGWGENKFMKTVLSTAASVIGRNPKDGAATTINCVVNPELKSQQALYYDSCKPVLSSADSRNEQFQEELWQISLDLVKAFLSPDLLEKYGPAQTTTSQPEAAGEATQGTSGGETGGAERGGEEEGQQEQPQEREEKSSEAETQEAGAGDTPTQEAGAGDTPTQEAGAGDTPTQEAGAGDTPTQEAGAGDTPTQEAGAGDTPTQEGGAGDTPTQEGGAGDTPTQEKKEEEEKAAAD